MRNTNKNFDDGLGEIFQEIFNPYWSHKKKKIEETDEQKLKASILEGIQKGWIAVDLRLHDNNGVARNHGTGFRIMELDFPKLFEERIEI